MFFVEDQPEKSRPDPTKAIYVYENGVIDEKPREFKIMRKKDNFREIKAALKYHHLRLFNSEGAEYFEDDLEFVKNKTTLYASKGEDFDPISTFGEYEMIKRLGEGGFGQVDLARHRQTGEEFAIKIIKADKLGSAAEIDSIFVEAETLKSLKHENIVKVHNCLTLKSMQVAIVMEYLEGGQLLTFVQKQGHLSEATSQIFFKQIVKAMSYCHANGLIHRDLKLENMLLVASKEMKIKIIDFGIAGIIKSLSWEDLDIGSLGYMAPQCFVNNKGYQVDGRIDVWAAGVILYAMLTGELPFKGATPPAIIQAIKSGSFKIPSKIVKSLSESCLDILFLCLQGDPHKRPTMQDLQSHPWISGQLFQATTNKVKVLEVLEQKKQEQQPTTIVKTVAGEKNLKPKPKPKTAGMKKDVSKPAVGKIEAKKM